jgi:AcrR family transcriptional regulator
MTTKDETRRAILAAAQSLFTRYGPVKTSVADIARDLGMSPANIYNFYPSRDAIMEAVGTQNLIALQQQITDEIARTPGDWARIAVLFMSTARHMHAKLANEKDILQLQALATKNRWKFVEEFHDFLHKTAETVLREAIDAGRLHHSDPAGAISALFDCMISAWDPVLILKFKDDDHFGHITAQLNLLERAFH